MPARSSEAFVLGTWPFREGDLIVSFLTRDLGKLRGVARRARRPKSGFGSSFERLSHVRISYYQKDTRELVNIDSCELIASQFGLLTDFSAACVLDFFAEVSEQLLPAAEPSEKYFRLLGSILDYLRTREPGAVWRAATYFSLWAVRLNGFLPELGICLGCSSSLSDERAFYTRLRAGLICASCRRALDVRGSWELTPESRAIAADILRTPVAHLSAKSWTQSTAADLRRFLAQQMESHIERRLLTVPALEAAA